MCGAEHQPFFTCVFHSAYGTPRLSDADAISYLYRKIVIANESLRTQFLELSRSRHHPKWPHASACGAPRRTGTKFVKHKARSGGLQRRTALGSVPSLYQQISSRMQVIVLFFVFFGILSICSTVVVV